jgi:peptide deformylase
MALRPILIHPDPRLKKRCMPVEAVDDRLRALMSDMLETMYDAPGIGLAAPQIGVDARVVVMDCAGKDEPPEPLRLVNPEILWSSEETNDHEEGCLSIPEVFGLVTRPERVRVRWLDETGAEREAEFDGIRATCVQHEIDHLNGKLFIDYLTSLKRQLITRKMVKLKKERAREREGA